MSKFFVTLLLLVVLLEVNARILYIDTSLIVAGWGHFMSLRIVLRLKKVEQIGYWSRLIIWLLTVFMSLLI